MKLWRSSCERSSNSSDRCRPCVSGSAEPRAAYETADRRVAPDLCVGRFPLPSGRVASRGQSGPEGRVLLAALDARRPTREVDLQGQYLSNDTDDVLTVVKSTTSVQFSNRSPHSLTSLSSAKQRVKDGRLSAWRGCRRGARRADGKCGVGSDRCFSWLPRPSTLPTPPTSTPPRRGRRGRSGPLEACRTAE